MKKKLSFIAWLLVFTLVSVCFISACDKKGSTGDAGTGNGAAAPTDDPVSEARPEEAAEQEKTADDPIAEVPEDAPNPVVTITMENGNEIVLELYRDKAPNTVYNFISLAQSGYYDGLDFHRVSEGFMIQGGCPEGTGYGNPGYGIKGEFSSNGYTDNDISHIPGVISMARSDNPDSAGSQFFICAGDASFLDGKYAAFGVTISGLKEVYEIAKLNAEDGPPSTPQKIISVTVDTSGVKYPKPETVSR